MIKKNNEQYIKNKLIDERNFSKSLLCQKHSISNCEDKILRAKKIEAMQSTIEQTGMFNCSTNRLVSITKGEKLLIRIDCSGTIPKPLDPELLSSTYAKHKTDRKSVV